MSTSSAASAGRTVELIQIAAAVDTEKQLWGQVLSGERLEGSGQGGRA